MDGDKNTQKKNTSGFKPLQFLLAFLVVFFIFATFLFAIDFVPEAPGAAKKSSEKNASTNASTNANVSTSFTATPVAGGAGGTTKALTGSTQKEEAIAAERFPVENPIRIQAPSVGIDTPVENPSSANSEVLDSALLKGAVRYPASGLLGENARMYIFAHQSYLPIVHNQAFKAFNGIQKLKGGDEIIISSGTATYHYRVSSVKHVNADDASIEIGSGERTLILSTCDVFGKKTDRYVVTADFVSEEAL